MKINVFITLTLCKESETKFLPMLLVTIPVHTRVLYLSLASTKLLTLSKQLLFPRESYF